MPLDLPPSEAVVDPKEAAEHAGLVHVSDERPGIRRRRAGKGFRYANADGMRVDDPAALKRIKSKSELQELWDESKNSDKWYQAIAELESRLK